MYNSAAVCQLGFPESQSVSIATYLSLALVLSRKKLDLTGEHSVSGPNDSSCFRSIPLQTANVASDGLEIFLFSYTSRVGGLVSRVDGLDEPSDSCDFAKKPLAVLYCSVMGHELACRLGEDIFSFFDGEMKC